MRQLHGAPIGFSADFPATAVFGAMIGHYMAAAMALGMAVPSFQDPDEIDLEFVTTLDSSARHAVEDSTLKSNL